MAQSDDTPDDHELPPLPIDAAHWKAVTTAIGLSEQQAQVVQLMLRGACDKQIADLLGIRKATVRTYLERASVRTRTRGRMQLAMYIWGVSHRVK